MPVVGRTAGYHLIIVSARQAAFGSRSMTRESARIAPSMSPLLVGLHCPRWYPEETLYGYMVLC